MAAAQSLVAQLRRRIKDERPARVAFRLSCVDESATDCVVAISQVGVLSTTVFNARQAQALSLDLTSFEYSSIRKLAEYIQSQPGYVLSLEQDYSPDHPAADLVVVGSMSILGEASAFKHHLFSDQELTEVLEEACKRHNVSYNTTTVPEPEQPFVLMLADATVQRRLAMDAAKRRGLDATVNDLLSAASAIEVAYRGDVQRQARAIPTPKFDEDAEGTGDVVIGAWSRRSMRTGFMAPMAAGLPPTPPKLEDPAPEDVEDTKVMLRWRRNHDLSFYCYEIWRDTIPDVRRPNLVQLNTDNPSLLRQVTRWPGTARLVFRTLGPHTNRDNIGSAIFMNTAGQLLTEFVDTGPADAGGSLTSPPLEPETTYYYRLFVVGLNFEVAGSNVVSATTKAMRALMRSTSTPISPTRGPAGTVVTIYGQRFTGLTGGTPAGYVTLGGKNVTPTLVNDTTMTFVVPTFYNPDALNTMMDLVVGSPNTGLRDVYSQGFEYTS